MNHTEILEHIRLQIVKLRVEVAELRRIVEPVKLELEEPENDGTDPMNSGQYRRLDWPEGGGRDL